MKAILMTSPRVARSAGPNTILGVVLTAYLMILLDLSIVYTGMPEIGRTMGMSPVMQTWVQNAYLLCFGGFLLLSARLGDTFGRRRILQVGVVLFTLASLVIGIAQTQYELIAARAVQGFGASILAPSVLAIISTTFPEGSERTRALAWYSVVAGAGASLGLVLGGIFAGLLSWRIGFLVNIPIGIGLMFAVARYIPDNAPTKGRFDVIGAIASTVGVGLLVYGLVSAADAGWLAPATLVTMALSIAVLGFFVWHEGRVDVPVLPLRLLRSRERSAAYLARMLYVGSIVSFFFFGTQLMQRGLGYSALQAGLGFLPMTLVQFAAAMAIPRVTRMVGGVPMLMGALLLISVGLFWLAFAGADASFWQLALPMVVIGIGNGAAMAPLTTSGVRGVEGRDQGAASGLVNVAHQLGGSIGLSVLIVIFAANANPQLASAAEMSHQVSAVFIGAAIMNLIALILTAIFILPANRKNADPTDPVTFPEPAE
ncbi:MFS transporter [Brucella lupini]|uniref:Sugar (And other) transporter family protein n=2 Tax=Brucella lupini TaxID=255457 RepID=A0A256GZ18_9HYPH|nr:MFS transporter [Brucella lupini]OYR32413.1 sugar (and other) transporter family protein [Brucella lupini]